MAINFQHEAPRPLFSGPLPPAPAEEPLQTAPQRLQGNPAMGGRPSLDRLRPGTVAVKRPLLPEALHGGLVPRIAPALKEEEVVGPSAVTRRDVRPDRVP